MLFHTIFEHLWKRCSLLMLSCPLSMIDLIFQPNLEWLEFVENHEPLECHFFHKMLPSFCLQILYHCWLFFFLRKAIGVAVVFESCKYFVSRLGRLQRCYVNILSMMISYVYGPCVLLCTITRTVTEVH